MLSWCKEFLKKKEKQTGGLAVRVMVWNIFVQTSYYPALEYNHADCSD